MTALDGIYRIDRIGRGYLAIAAHPASAGDAEGRIAAIAASGIHQLISLLTPQESRALGLEREAEMAGTAGMEFVSLPMADMGLPDSIERFSRLSARIYRQLNAGCNSLIHCRAGIGRSGLLAAAVLLHDGLDAQQAFARVARMRGEQVPETDAQGAWLGAHQATISGVANVVSQ